MLQQKIRLKRKISTNKNQEKRLSNASPNKFGDIFDLKYYFTFC